MIFQVSDKVVLITDQVAGTGTPASLLGTNVPELGKLYVVRAAWQSHDGYKTPLIQLVGFPDVFHPYTGQPCGWGAWRFRKLSAIQAENAQKRVAEKDVIAAADAVLRPYIEELRRRGLKL